MTWVKLDDGFATHPKIEELSDRALRTHLRGLCFCARHLTDGHIPTKTARSMGGTQTIRELVESDLWEANGSGYIVHDFTDYNPTRAEVEEGREKRHARGVAGARARWAKDAKTNAPSMARSNDTVDAPVPSPSDLRNQEDDDGGNSARRHAVDELILTLDDPEPQTRLKLLGLVARGLSESDIRYVDSQVKKRRPTNRTAYAVKSLEQRLRERSIA